MRSGGIDIACLEVRILSSILAKAKQLVLPQTGHRPRNGQKVSRLLKDSNSRFRRRYRVTSSRDGQKRDDLQEAIAFCARTRSTWPLQFNNFRD